MSKMADATVRREARRRRILENSHSRLQLISGKCSDECPPEPTTRNVIPEPVYEIPVVSSNSSYSKLSQHNGVIVSEPETFEFLTSSSYSSNHESEAGGDGELFSDLAPLVPPAPEPASTLSIWDKLVLYKYDMVLLSLTIQMLYGLSIVTFESGYYFLPAIVYIVTKIIWFPSQSNSSIANVLLLLNGMSPERVRKILFVTQCFSIVTRDIFVYLFTTICIQSLWITLKENLVT